MKKIIYLLISTLMMMFFQCRSDREGCHKNIKIINNSNRTIRGFTSIDYPDSLSGFFYNDTYFPIEPHSYASSYSYGCYESAIPNQNKYGILMYFIIDNNIFENYPIDTIFKNRMYLKKYDLTVEDLEKSKWVITYP